MIWNYALEEIISGHADEGEQFVCVACGRCFEKGRIYELDGELFDAWGAVRQHVLREHGSMAEFLEDREPGVIGVTEVQRQILKLILEGKRGSRCPRCAITDSISGRRRSRPKCSWR